MAAVALMLAGCGGADESDLVAAQSTLTAYGHAYAARDGDAVCRLLTTPMRKRYERHGETCPEAFARNISSERRLRLKRAAVTGERDGGISGVVSFSESDWTRYGGGVLLTESGERWLLDEDLACLTPGCDP